jgi:anti-sigma B factor antagonist
MIELMEPGTMSSDFVHVTVVHSISVIELRLPEQLDSTEFDQLNEALMGVLDRGIKANWLLDLSSVDYMGSSVLGLMINIRQHIKTGGGKLALAGLSPRMTQIFRTCCLERLFQIGRDREEAMKLLGAKL